MKKFSRPNAIVDQVIGKVGRNIILGTPLGIGKANHFLNALYLRAKNDPSIQLTILTALTLAKPKPSSDLEQRFLGPFLDRVFGNYPDLLYQHDRIHQTLPKNVKVIEFYFPPGKFLKHSFEQQNYLSSNYTHAARDILNRGVNVLCQLTCPGSIDGEDVYSLSSNPDITIDIVSELKKKNKPFAVIGEINHNLPFMYGESIVPSSFFDFVLDQPGESFDLFSPPKMSVPDCDYMIGLHASTLVKDDGELQIGIGSLGDALVYALCLRHKKNNLYREILHQFDISKDIFPIVDECGDLSSFDKGVFAPTEMFVDSFAELYKANILKKKVYDSVIVQRLINEKKIEEHFNASILHLLFHERAICAKLTLRDVEFLKEIGVFKSCVRWEDHSLILEDGFTIGNNILDPTNYNHIKERVLGSKLRNGAVAHAGFFLGPRSFYQFLKELPTEQRKLIRMKRVSQINQLYGHEEIDRLQRKNARFINTCMKVTLNGSANSDALDNGSQVSGVGGQYNFVAMAHELPEARSVLQLRSVRTNRSGRFESNIVFNYGNCTIPRHLRDIVITEYGIADLRSKTDEEVAIALIQITDSRFQEDLLSMAKEAGKIRDDYQIPQRFKKNFPDRYIKVLKKLRADNDLFPPFPFGHDFSEEELVIGKALKYLKSKSKQKGSFLIFLLQGLLNQSNHSQMEPYLKRMGLDQPKNMKEKIYQRMLLAAFKKV